MRRPNLPFASLLATVLAFGALLVSSCSSDPPPARRIVLVTLDTLRADVFEDAARMPATHAWAASGRVFANFWSASSSTQPTHASLFTGLPPWRHGVPRNGTLLRPDFETLAERFGAAGYATGAVVASFPVHRTFGFDQGFDVFDDAFVEGDVKKWSGLELDGTAFHSPARHVTDKALEMLGGLGGETQFLWFHYFDPHAPYGEATDDPRTATPGRALVEIAKGGDAAALVARARERYDADVALLDTELGRLFERLERDARTTETHVFVVSDHGESFGEDGSLGHGKRLLPEQIRVPGFLVSPRSPKGTIDAHVGSTDVFATLLALGGLPSEPSSSGRDVCGAFEAGPVFGMRRTFVTPYDEPRTDGSVRRVPDTSFFIASGELCITGNSDALRLFDRTPFEDEEADTLRALFTGFERELGAQDVFEPGDPELWDKLRALGYAR